MKKNNIIQLIRPDIAEMKAYIPGTSSVDLAASYNQDIASLIKLNANENSYGFSPVVRKALSTVYFNYYPASDYVQLRSIIASYCSVQIDTIIVTSGSDELIDLLLRITLQENDTVINCTPTFGMYSTLTKLNRGVIVESPRNNDFSLNVDDIIQKSKDHRVKVIFLCNPNSPTGNLSPAEDIIKILQTGKLVVVDETYFEFSNTTVSHLLGRYDNLIILRTFSKWAGLAGLRIGYGLMSKVIIQQLFKIKPPFNVNAAAEAAAIATINDLSFTKKTIQTIILERGRLYDSLCMNKSLQVFPSSGNFIFIRTKTKDYENIRDLFEKNKIALRYYDAPLLKNGIRITVGKPFQNDLVLAVVKEYYENV